MSEEKVQGQPQKTGGGADVEVLIAEFRSAQRYRRWVVRAVAIAIIIVVLVGIYSYYSYGKGVVTELQKKETQVRLMERAQRDLVPDIQEEAQRLYEVLRPKIVKLAQERAEAARPEIVAILEKQQQIFVENMTALLQTKVEEVLTQVIEEQKETLQADFPEITDPAKMEALVQLLVDATTNAAVTVFINERLDNHIEVLKAMDHKIKLLPVRDESNEELFRRLGEVAVELLGRMRPVAEEAAGPAAAQ